MRDIDKKRVGIYPKFIVKRSDGQHRKGKKHERCTYFVLDTTHDPFAAPALRAYANACDDDGYHALAKELHDRAFQLENAQQDPGPA